MTAPVRCCLRPLLVLSGIVLALRATAAPGGPRRPYIVCFQRGAAVTASVSVLGKRLRFQPRRVYQHALPGFAADLDDSQVAALRSDSRVLGVYPDAVVSLPEAEARSVEIGARGVSSVRKKQQLPTGITRCGAHLSPTAAIDGVDNPLDIDIAVMDTGIDPKHPDLNVVGGISYVPPKNDDFNGHGSHTAGTIAARDNGIGVVGVAPGARLWSIRVLDKNGHGTYADVVSGLDWILASDNPSKVVNMSLGGAPPDDTPVRMAIDAVVNAGIVVVAAAGNENSDARSTVPARYDNVICVSALADNNGQGGLSTGSFKVIKRRFDQDESFMNFDPLVSSNYGPQVDLIAPGVSILSTFKKKNYAFISGTSMSCAYVSGAAALYKLTHPAATPAEVRNALVQRGTPFTPEDDPDGIHEPALDVSGL